MLGAGLAQHHIIFALEVAPLGSRLDSNDIATAVAALAILTLVVVAATVSIPMTIVAGLIAVIIVAPIIATVVMTAAVPPGIGGMGSPAGLISEVLPEGTLGLVLVGILLGEFIEAGHRFDFLKVEVLPKIMVIDEAVDEGRDDFSIGDLWNLDPRL